MRNTIYLNPYGNIYGDTFVSFDLQDNYKKICVGNILKESIFDIISKWNSNLENMPTDTLQKKIRYEVFGELVERDKTASFLAEEYAKRGMYQAAEDTLDRIKLYYEKMNSERNIIVNQVNPITAAINKGDDSETAKLINEYGLYEDYVKAVNILVNTEDSIKQISEQMKDMRRVLKIRAEKNLPGSLFEDPNRKPYSAKNLYMALLKQYIIEGGR